MSLQFFSDECDEDTCQDLSERPSEPGGSGENMHTQVNTENHGLAPSIRARGSSNSTTENRWNGDLSRNNSLV